MLLRTKNSELGDAVAKLDKFDGAHEGEVARVEEKDQVFPREMLQRQFLHLQIDYRDSRPGRRGS